ncbi:acyl-CoA-binding domain-containing protein 4-like [Salarias fasciatus]|uniref:Acyl-CoA-binding domain-containing protein 4-like n=1 Tax=Salarias fasciatus TaxID=181472 RepID=A0A672H351_SALFA|nr:acyl-CoA-binding domain-containing protein 4-like [Salarias fasciatus]XP_029953410.1 acyl-CoA-binding domain-containing protein 4-like [Salarias fasciatus]XP_029953411.1 acyl-CoA-binding domain-containing protein 4-like [Salarias fasciatus]XP_029953412.1 acyl-CoA-binding domain-containing protein 4-like [Salarias fasciatus]
MPVPAMAEPAVSHQRRFQAAVDVIHNLPKNGSYRPSYEVMLRFYSLYKQAVCGPCSVSRPGFWDPVGRYKWDAWSRLGQMSSESAMAAYVDEMKKVAQEVIDTMPMNEKTASLFTHFEPLYQVIHDMPRPPPELLSLREMKSCGEDQDVLDPPVGPGVEQEVASCGHVTSSSHDPRVAEGVALTSDSESEVFCDSVEQLSAAEASDPHTNGVRHGGRQAGAGHGGEGAEDGRGRGPHRRARDSDRDPGREAPRHGWREGGVPQGGPGPGRRSPGAGGGAGPGGGDGAEPHDARLQQQIVLALRRLREDMRSVMERLEAVERLAAAQAQASDWRRCGQCAAPQQDSWWSLDVSSSTLLLLLLWPFAAQALVFLLKRLQRRTGGGSE